MRVWKHGRDITQILIGYVLSDLRFDWSLGNKIMSVCQENLFQSRRQQQQQQQQLLLTPYTWKKLMYMK